MLLRKWLKMHQNWNISACILQRENWPDKKEKDDISAMEYYMKAIHITLPDFDGKSPLRNNLLTFDEIMIINAIAILHADLGEIVVAVQLDMWLKEYMGKQSRRWKNENSKISYDFVQSQLLVWHTVLS